MKTAWLIADDGSAASVHAENCAIHGQWYQHAPALYHQCAVASFRRHRALLRRQVGRGLSSRDDEAAIAHAHQKLDKAGLAYSAPVLVGDAALTIVGFFKDKSCSLIIVGAQGVATKVLQLSLVLVLVNN